MKLNRTFEFAATFSIGWIAILAVGFPLMLGLSVLSISDGVGTSPMGIMLGYVLKAYTFKFIFTSLLFSSMVGALFGFIINR